MIYCRECGKKISDTASSCPSCGARQSGGSKGGGFVDVENEMTFGKKISDIREAVKSTINSLGWKIKDESGDAIGCSTGMSLMSFGSNVFITLKSAGGKTIVEIHSKDKLGAMGSLGGNLQSKSNIKKFFNELSKRVAVL